jgi:hypothetical protein
LEEAGDIVDLATSLMRITEEKQRYLDCLAKGMTFETMRRFLSSNARAKNLVPKLSTSSTVMPSSIAISSEEAQAPKAASHS